MQRYFFIFWISLSLTMSFSMELENKEGIENKLDSFVILPLDSVSEEKEREKIFLESLALNQDMMKISEKNFQFAVFFMTALKEKTYSSMKEEEMLYFIQSIAQDTDKIRKKNLHDLYQFLKEYDLSGLIGASIWNFARDLEKDSFNYVISRFPEWFIDFKGDHQFASKLLEYLRLNQEGHFNFVRNKRLIMTFLKSSLYKNHKFNVLSFFKKNPEKASKIPEEMVMIAESLKVSPKEFDIFFQVMTESLTKEQMVILGERFKTLIKEKDYEFCSDEFFIALAKLSQEKMHYLDDNFLIWLLQEKRRSINHILLSYINEWSHLEIDYFVNTFLDWLEGYDFKDDIIILSINETMLALKRLNAKELTSRLYFMRDSFLSSFGLISYGFGQNTLLPSEKRCLSNVIKNFFYLSQEILEHSIRLSAKLTEKIEDSSGRIFYYSLKLSREYPSQNPEEKSKNAEKFLERIKSICPNEEFLEKTLKALCQIKDVDREEAFNLWTKSQFRKNPEYLTKLNSISQKK